MADIFISYSKADRPLALKLAAMLEAEGWKTWWDTSLRHRYMDGKPMRRVPGDCCLEEFKI